MTLVLNEWLFHDLLGENGPEAFSQTAEFLLAFWSSNDRMVRPDEERWTRKAFSVTRMSDPRGRQVGQLFLRLLLDPGRCILVKPDEFSPADEGLYDWVPRKDTYLVLAYVASDAGVLVTTDEGLFQAIAEHGGIDCRMRDDFLRGYSSSETSA